MKRFVFLFLSTIIAMVSAEAQTFTQYLEKSQAGKGKVSISQSRDIDALVNGNITLGVTAAEAQKQTVKKNTTTTANAVSAAVKNDSMKKNIARQQEEKPKVQKNEKAKVVQKDEKPKVQQDEKPKVQQDKQNAVEEALALQRRIAEKNAEEKRKEAEEKRQIAETKKQTTEEDAESELHIPTVDMRKKVMRGAHKVTGYRVQAFAGGNTRADKTKAQQAGNNIKMKFPDQPIYVHFYSPRWICRVGNYRSLNEATQMLKAIKAMGYKTAVIVKGQITVFD